MKILFVISCLSYGGAEKNLVLVANHLSKKHEVIVCSFNEHETKQELSEKICFYEKIKEKETHGRFAWIGVRVRQYQYLKQICKIEKPDVIVSFLPIPNAIAVVAGKVLKIPVVISERADPYQNMSKMDPFLHFLYNRADGAVFQTEGAKSFYAKALQLKSVIIPNPVMLKEGLLSHDYENADKSIAFAGRFEIRQKRQDIMLKAMKIVHRRYPEYKLRLWGDGPDETKIKEMAYSLGIESIIEFEGVTDSILEGINKSEIFVMTSDYEGIPNVLIEAMSIGMPCIATDCSPGGARMLLDNGKYGALVETNNPAAVAERILHYIEHKDNEKYYGEKAKTIKDRFVYEEIMQKWEEYLSKFMKE